MDGSHWLRRLWAFAIFVALLGPPARQAAAAGFQIQEQSARALGSAFVGEAAAAQDATTLFYNPAGATLLEGLQLDFSGTLVRVTGQFTNTGSTLNPRVGGGPLLGENEVDGGEIGFVGSGFLVYEVSDRWRLGLGVTAPWGLSVGFDRPWVGRYNGLTADLKTIDVAPTVAVKLLDQLSFGVGLDVQYAYVKLTNMIDLGSVCELNASQFGIPPEACGAVGLTPQSTDGHIRIRGTSWAVGYNLGFLWHPTSRTRVGLSYRSRIDQDIGADVTFDLPKRAQVLRQTSGALKNGGADATLNLPEVVRLGIYHAFTEQWAIQTGVDWTHWSRFDELVLNFDNPAQPALAEQEQWHDTWRTGLAVLYHPFERWGFRMGFAYDPTPVPNAEHRTPRIPDHDRYWLAAGVGYALTEQIKLQFGYAHVFSQNARSNAADPLTGNTLRGYYAGNADLFSAQVSWQFQ